MLKWIKFYHTEDSFVQTLFVENGHFQDDGMTHPFTDSNDAIARSEDCVAVFWDGVFKGVGALHS